MIIGITGTLGAGKGTVVEILKERGFSHFSVRDFLTEELKKRGMEVAQHNMALVANDLRAKFGASYIVEAMYKRAFEKGGNVVIESLRCPGEIEALRGKKDFVLWAVDADVENRYTRIIERKSSTQAEKNYSFQEFVEKEQFQMGNRDPTMQNLGACIEMADVVFRNDWTIQELKGKVEKILNQNFRKVESRNQKVEGYVRPTWDEYFMEICRAVAKRGTCDRGRSGCVIVRNKQILVSGYVGSPIGLPHCDEVGHQFEDTIHEDGVKRTHCIRTTHAEQNAICQAAKLGISIDGATLYCKMEPCPVCAKMIINSGILRVVCEKRYQSGAQSLLEEAGVSVEVLVNEIEKY
ncbi:AAA family ATPase [Candidatus Pacearchaeota archaeon]|nr:AAA family ATPase [Candidatus Pacearchaeota archaeon]